MGTSCKIIVVLHEPVMPASFQGEFLFKNMALCLDVFGVEVQALFLHPKMLFILLLCSTLFASCFASAGVSTGPLAAW